jgi:glycosyltransferase involved in cell wall biosynthesis
VRAQGGWLTPFEAISAGCPVIVSNELTCSDMIENNQLGLVARDYAKALIRVRECPNIQGMTNIAREWVKNNLTWDKFGQSMVSYFEEVLCR